MVKAINVRTHPDFTLDEFVRYTGWPVPSPAYRANMQRALEFFQRTVPRRVLREDDAPGPYGLRINGSCVRLTNWMQAINYHLPVNPQRTVAKGNPLYAYTLRGRRPGNWYTFPSTGREELAIHSSQVELHKLKARSGFTCMQSTAADAYVCWVRGAGAEYQHGSGQQLFIWGAPSFLEPV
jgi:hypothetical protein